MKSSEQQPMIKSGNPEQMVRFKNNVALVGFMGTGKTTVGRLLADKYELAFIDIDECIAKKVSMDIPTIFSRHGETFFRNLEEEILKEILTGEFQVVSCGGGIIVRESNRTLLKRNAVTCWLYNSVETSLSRISGTGRPLINRSEPVQKAMDLYREREAYYREVASCSLCTENLGQAQIATMIGKEFYTNYFLNPKDLKP